MGRSKIFPETQTKPVRSDTGTISTLHIRTGIFLILRSKLHVAYWYWKGKIFLHNYKLSIVSC